MEAKKPNLDALTKLRELGLNPEVETKDDLSWLKLKDADNTTASIPFNLDKYSYQNQKVIVPEGTQIPQKWQGKGVATESYKAMENYLGAPVVPDDTQTFSGYKLHDNKGYGKEFGLSDEALDKVLTPTEKLQRNSRKAALQQVLSESADLLDQGKSPEAILNAGKFNLDTKLGANSKRNTGSILENALKQYEKSIDIRKNIPSLLGKVKSVAPLVGTAAALTVGSASDALADTLVPGGVESLGQNSDTPMSDELEQIKTFASSATDPNVRRAAMQEIRNRSR